MVDQLIILLPKDQKLVGTRPSILFLFKNLGLDTLALDREIGEQIPFVFLQAFKFLEGERVVQSPISLWKEKKCLVPSFFKKGEGYGAQSVLVSNPLERERGVQSPIPLQREKGCLVSASSKKEKGRGPSPYQLVIFSKEENNLISNFSIEGERVPKLLQQKNIGSLVLTSYQFSGRREKSLVSNFLTEGDRGVQSPASAEKEKFRGPSLYQFLIF